MAAAVLPDSLDHRFATVNGITMHYAVAGEGTPVLFLHGFPEFWYSWRHQIAEFARDHRVVAPDLRGYNETEDSGPYDTETLQDDVEALIHEIGAERVHVVGHDWGGNIAWLLAIQRPHLVESLAVCNIPHPAVFQSQLRGNPRQMLRSWYVLAFQIPWLPERMVARDEYRGLARMLIRDCKPGTFTKEDIRMFLASWRRQGLGGGINWYRSIMRSGPPRMAVDSVIEVPTTLIWGDNDRALGAELVDGTEEYVRDLTVHFVPGASHWVQQEEPEIVNQHLRRHLERFR